MWTTPALPHAPGSGNGLWILVAAGRTGGGHPSIGIVNAIALMAGPYPDKEPVMVEKKARNVAVWARSVTCLSPLRQWRFSRWAAFSVLNTRSRACYSAQT